MEWLLSFLGIALSALGLTAPTIDYVYVKDKKSRVSFYMALTGLLLALGVFTFTVVTYLGEPIFVYDRALKLDFYGIFLALTATLGAILVLAASASIKEWSTSPSFYSLFVLGLLGVYYLIFVNDLVLLITAWALVSVISYVITGIKKDPSSVEGAVKYAVMGILASILMLFAVANIYGLTGTTNISEITGLLSSRAQLTESHQVLLLLLLFISAFGFKIGVVPFHGWLPDVYGGVYPTMVSFLIGVVKVAGVAAMLRMLFPLSSLTGNVWLLIFALLSIFTMTFGNVVALVQSNFQRMMAYSSIAHVGYILTGVTALSSLGLTGKAFGIEFALPGIAIQLLAYVTAKVGIFVSLSYFLKSRMGVMLEDLRGVGRSMPVASTSIAILIFSLMGVPPLLGFWGKFFLFTSVISIAPWLTFIALMNSGLSVGYYVQIIKYMFFMRGGSSVKEEIRDIEVIVLAAAAALTVLLGILAPLISPYLTKF